jgi:hypothetical protein
LSALMSAIRSLTHTDELYRVRALARALAGERHVQEPLLRELIDLASLMPALQDVRERAMSLLECVQAGMSDKEFDWRARMLAHLVERASLARRALNDAIEPHPEGPTRS